MTGIHGRVGAMVIFLGMSGWVGTAIAQDTAMQSFMHRVNGYMEIRHQVVAQLPPVVIASDWTTITASSEALAQRIAAVRSGAKAGDIFTPDGAVVFQALIADALRQHGYAPAQIARDIDSEARDAPATLKVNGRFYWTYGAMMPACVLEALPPLPAGLQFRFVGHDLVLVDIDAGLIVDVLRSALEAYSS